VVNAAGVIKKQPSLEMPPEEFERIVRVNLTGSFIVNQAAGRVMKDQGGGRIINIPSPASRMALPDYAAYAASKAGVDSVTRAAAVALAPHGILVNSLAPGMMDTEMQRSTEAELARVNGRDDLEAFLDERTRRVPLGRRAEIAEVAEAVVWLCLDAPPYMTAERLNMSGGMDRD
jgi:NAD(P)-dependent dehydrogenase (short-subunit alcohol dehydrogenase family)